ncbi:MAG: vanadium-dependent haloperoxidase, partial [Pirellulaceae bacterium]
MSINNFSQLGWNWFRSGKTVRTSKRNDSGQVDRLSYETLEARQLLAGDMVVQWNEQLLDAIRTSKSAPPVASRAMAIVHTAIYDAVNSIFNHYEPYATSVAVHPKASADAAVAAAAERTLSSLFPSLQATFSAAYSASLATIPDGIREDQGAAAGHAVADQILALRANDGWDTTISYTPGSDPGDWVPTPSAFAAAAFPQWGYVTPWAMSSGDQFRPEAPPSLDSERYAIDYNMVKDLGALNSTTRTAAQTEVAKIWAGGPGTATPPGQWNMIAQDLAGSQGNSLYENARMFAMLNVSLADAAINAWDAKYEFNLWRPITAINQGDLDGNAATVKDANWTPLLNTPNFPSYTSGHSTFSGAASAALTGFFGTDKLNFKLVSEVSDASTRYFDSLAWAAREAGFSRIFGGIHFNCDNVEALKAGRSIGELVSRSLMQTQTNVVAHSSGHELYVSGTTANDNIYVFRSGSD